MCPCIEGDQSNWTRELASCNMLSLSYLICIVRIRRFYHCDDGNAHVHAMPVECKRADSDQQNHEHTCRHLKSAT